MARHRASAAGHPGSCPGPVPQGHAQLLARALLTAMTSPELPRTNNDLGAVFWRPSLSRTAGDRPKRCLRPRWCSAARYDLVACCRHAAAGLCGLRSSSPANLDAWQDPPPRPEPPDCQHRAPSSRRFRRDPASYLAQLEADSPQAHFATLEKKEAMAAAQPETQQASHQCGSDGPGAAHCLGVA